LPPPSRHDLEAEGLEVIEERAHSLLLDGAVLVSGQVERVTEFETGFPIHQAREEDRWRPDPMIWDDQALVLNVRDRGLVIISGCSHAGVINVLRHAQRLTGETRIAGLLGGLHLTGGLFEARIQPTVAALRATRVGRVLPAHCSGWRAVHAIAQAMPDAFVQSAVGTTVTFEAPASSR
jgi:7,8-dihydropterin-6-yl-methyl-4-(beta-D-ribofuranosyl)aminobenzene 5'-phosphate synthase